METVRQLQALLVDGKSMSTSSHCTYCRGAGGRVRHREGKKSAGRSDTLSTELCTQREAEKQGSEE